MKKKIDSTGENIINVNVNSETKKEGKVSKIFNIGKTVTSLIADEKWEKIIKVYFVFLIFLITALCGFFFYKFVNNDELMVKATKNIIDDKKEEGLRDFVVTPKIQRDVEILLYTLNADRVFIFEFHNGKKNISGLPFKYADMTYEEANREKKIDRCYKKYQDVPLTMYKYTDYLHKKKLFVGTVNEIEEADFELAKNIKEDGGEYIGIVYLNGTDGPLGFLAVSFHDKDSLPPDSIIEEKLKYYGKSISELLDLKTQLNNIN